ncbi:MAG TPA: carbamoyltransferase HypF [Candidatus Marinimicrobia bacterium]|nr:carbamoyltransferase HypF [Candidatus Neomarinimicrobiota bacterium]
MTLIATDFQPLRSRILVNGIVQGVGFRPFVFNLAEECGLTGFVANSSNGVEIEIEGDGDSIAKFHRCLNTQAPPLAVLVKIEKADIPPQFESTFKIISSKRTHSAATLISPDVAVCPNCLSELFDPTDRRFQYPFINCTNCGPRYTIIEAIPYDRPFTSMRHFKMCPECQQEYDDPRNRRFHAQPNACPTCGPKIWLVNGDNKPVAGDALDLALELIESGNILAVRGLGGFHLVVDATNQDAVMRLRERKHREAKPLAVMFPSLEAITREVQINATESALLTSFIAPIVLCKKLLVATIADAVAPHHSRLGVMLPYTPLHHLLLSHFGKPLVMTSANLSEEPICITNPEALTRLNGIADYFLLHDRDIYLRNDDSVMIHLAGKNRMIRRSRGFVPRPIFLPASGPSVLAVGGELKNTVCLTRQNQAFLSPYIGDMENLETYHSFEQTISHLQRVLEVKPELIIHDLHPDYLATQWAMKQGIPTLAVQHHHAHLAAAMAENCLTEPVIGVILDGTGFGTDGNIWGGEILVGDASAFSRFGHLENMLLPGGNAAIRAPWRTAVAYLRQSFDTKLPQLDILRNWEIGPILEMVSSRTNSPYTSSMGRLFDAISALAGGPGEIRYEGEAAIALMQACTDLNVPPFTFGIRSQESVKILCVKPLIRDVAHAILDGADFTMISNRFHRTLVNWLVKILELARRSTGINQIVLSGGVFQNEILLEALIPRLQSKNFEVFAHELVPTNDGGLALGQALIGQKYLEKMRLKQKG